MQNSRHQYTNKVGIDTQFGFLTKQIGLPPTWPVNGPYIHCLPSQIGCLSGIEIEKRYRRVFKPLTDWKFDAESHLADARVGFAIWER